MRIKDFIFSYNQIIFNFFYVKKKFLKGIRKIFNFPVKYLTYCLSIFLKKKKINLDNYKISSKNLDTLFQEFNSDKANNFYEAIKKISSSEKKLINCIGSLYNVGNMLLHARLS